MLSISPNNSDAADCSHHRGEPSMKSLLGRQIMHPHGRQGEHDRSQDAVYETQGGCNHSDMIGTRPGGWAFVFHKNNYARTSLRNGSMECPANDFGGANSRFAATEAEAQSRMSRYMSWPVILPNQRELVSDAIPT